MSEKLFLGLFLSLFASGMSTAAESPESFKDRLQKIQDARQSLQKDFNIGQLMMQNAQLQSQALDREEADIRAKMDAEKKTDSQKPKK